MKKSNLLLLLPLVLIAGCAGEIPQKGCIKQFSKDNATFYDLSLSACETQECNTTTIKYIDRPVITEKVITKQIECDSCPEVKCQECAPCNEKQNDNSMKEENGKEDKNERTS